MKIKKVMGREILDSRAESEPWRSTFCSLAVSVAELRPPVVLLRAHTRPGNYATAQQAVRWQRGTKGGS